MLYMEFNLCICSGRPRTIIFEPGISLVSASGLTMYSPFPSLKPITLHPVLRLKSNSLIVFTTLTSYNCSTYTSSMLILRSPTIPRLSINSTKSGITTREAIWSPPILSGRITLFAPANFNLL